MGGRDHRMLGDTGCLKAPQALDPEFGLLFFPPAGPLVLFQR